MNTRKLNTVRDGTLSWESSEESLRFERVGIFINL